MAMQRQVRFVDVAKAFSLLAAQPEKALNLAVEVADDTIRIIEVSGTAMAEQVRALIEGHAPAEYATAAPAAKGRTNSDNFTWQPIENPHASLGNKYSGFRADFGGHDIRLTKLSPANWEGSIDGKPIVHGKFRKNVRERIQKEAAKLVTT